MELCPTLLPSTISVPPLSPTSALAVSGPGTRVLACFTGDGRTARLGCIYPSDSALAVMENCSNQLRAEHERRKGRVWIFMDAAELDLEAGDKILPDFRNNHSRKVHGSDQAPDSSHDAATTTNIVSPPWGCGAFGGDIRVKLLLIWLAATMAQLQRFCSHGQWPSDRVDTGCEARGLG